LSEPIDDFDGLTPLNEWLHGDAERLAWAWRDVLALAQAADRTGLDRVVRMADLEAAAASVLKAKKEIGRYDFDHPGTDSLAGG